MTTTKHTILHKFKHNIEFSGDEGYYIHCYPDVHQSLLNMLSAEEVIFVVTIHKALKEQNASLLLENHALAVYKVFNEARLENLYDVAFGYQDMTPSHMEWSSKTFQAGTSLAQAC